MTTQNPKYYITFTAHDQQGEYKGYVKEVFFNELTGRKQISGSLRSTDALAFKSAISAQMKLNAIKSHEKEYDSLFPIEEMQVEVS